MSKAKSRDAFGNKTYELGVFFVAKHDNGKWHILKREPWYVTDAYIYTEPFMFWKVEPFDSFIQAVRWLKANHADLL